MLPLLLALAAAPADTVPASWTPHRVYDSRDKRFADFETLAAKAASADVIFFGEMHDDPGTHRMELALLEAVARRRADVILSLEMFERDVQLVLDDYLAGKIDEAAFRKATRPWPNYAADYRPLVEFAKAKGWKVVAANVPRPIASRVGKEGLAAVSQLPDTSRRWAAEQLACPMGKDRYYERFIEAMGGHSAASASGMNPDRFYEAQCVKDETMAESIVRARGTAPQAPLVVHMNGAFHSDFRLGTAERVQRRLPKAKLVVVTAVPVKSLDAPEPKEERKKGDWLIYTLAPEKKGS